MREDKKNLILKVTAWLGIIFVLIVMFTTTNFSIYIIESVGFIYALLYSYGKVRSKVALLVASAFFVLVYSVVNFAPIDLLMWAVILLTQVL
jgi:hypothetical protein